MALDHSLSADKHLSQIANMLILNGTLTFCPGLVNGKMGIAIFLFHYAKYTENSLFADYAMVLIEEIQNQIHTNSPASYQNGIAGIGVGVDYLIRNNFLDVESDIFDDFDQFMFRAVMYDSCPDFSLYYGLTGYGQYWISRLIHKNSCMQAQICLTSIAERIGDKLPDIPKEKQADVFCFLHDLKDFFEFRSYSRLLEKCHTWDLHITDVYQCFPRLGNSMVGNIVRLYQHRRYFNNIFQDEINMELKQMPDLDMEKAPNSMGLLTGYTGEGMLRLTAVNQNSMTWMNLL